MKRICPVCDTQDPDFVPLPLEYFQRLNQAQAAYSLEDFETLNLNQYLCSVCQSPDRDRLYALYFKQLISKQFKDKPLRVLDIAPSPALSRFLKEKNITYRSADLFSPLADDRIDITNMSCYLDGAFDFLICSHVLEHVQDDVTAIRELFRVLSPGGEAIIMVPILLATDFTDEDLNETCENERWRRFGQNDHVRMYCKQGFIDRLRKCGFEVFQLGVEFFGKDAFYSHGISLKSVLYIGRKPYHNYNHANGVIMNHSDNYNALCLENKKLKEELNIKNALLAFQDDFFYELRDIKKKKLYFQDAEKLNLIRKNYIYEKSFQEIEPLVSVIIPTFNRAKVIIERTIPSVLIQDYKNWELIIIGDAMNNEDCQTLIEGIKGISDKRIFFYNLNKRGRYPGRFGPLWYSAGIKPINFGLRIARGSWICHLDDDDEFLSNHISSLLALARQKKCEWVHGKVLFVPDAGDKREPIVIGSEQPGFGCISRISSIYHAALKTFRYNTNSWQYKYPGDWDLWERFLDMGVTHIHLPQIVSIHHGNMSIWYDKYANLVSTDQNTDIIADIDYTKIQENTYNIWRESHNFSTLATKRLIAESAKSLALAEVHLLLIADVVDASSILADMLDGLDTQTIANCRLTVFSEQTCSNPRFGSNTALEWVQVCFKKQTDAIIEAVKASPAEWFICALAGLRISPVFTLLAGLRLRDRPHTLLLYTDEDVIGADGEHANPKLKPDINLELLRSSPFIGAATLIHKSLMLDPRIAILPPGLSRNYGAALLAVEQGLHAIDHLDEILVHVPEALVDQYTATPLAHLLVQQHLVRCGTAAEVRDGLLPGTLFVDYQLPDQPPKISVIIAPAQGQLSDTRACLESLLTNTNYPDFEVLVIDQGIDSALSALLNEESSRFPQMQTLCCPQKQNLLVSYNAATRQAQGAFLLFLNADCIVLQQNWLMRLAAIGAHAEVGVVGCRLVSPEQLTKHAGLILGHGGTVDYIGKDLPLAEPGYMGRAQLTQNFSAVSSDCMLVRKELFLEVGGFDEKDFPNLYYDADFCLKVGERGYQIVWTPFVTLAQQNNGALDAKQEAQNEQQNSLSSKAFIKKWRSRLGNDPAYNRHLSLRQRTWMIDGDFDVPWHPDLEPLPRIVAQAPDEMGVGQYRMIGPLKELADSGRICSFLLPALNSDKRFLPYVSELIRAKPTVFFLQNAFSDFHLDDLQRYAELLPDLFRVFGQDDIVFSVPQKSSARKHFGKDTKARVRKAVSLCHRAIVTTEPIAEAMRGMVDDIRVMPNYLERSRWGDLQPPRHEHRKPRVGWAGAQQHQGDLEFILPAVEATANEVDWIFMGMCPPKLRYHVAETHPAVPFDQYPAALAALDLDLAIAPLELNRFNAAKSNLRLLEYGAVGYPVIATDILPYQSVPVTRVPNNPQAWIKAIREHVHALDTTHAEGERLREWVLSNWMLDQHLDEWLRALLPD